MRKKFKYVLFVLWFSYLIVSSILLFARGFLLSRDIQDINSTCLLLKDKYSCSSEIKVSFNTKDAGWCFWKDYSLFLHNSYVNASSLCLPPIAKVILLIIDALRYDFTIHDDSNIKPLPYENKLPVIKKMLSEFPNSTRLYKFIADPPTTTLQRLKALTTGSLPTFIDAGSNFATSEINEDNIIDQITKNKYKVVFMGDDTWTSLYPNRFLRNYPYPSFDVWDLDTVDDGVKSSLFPELSNTDWNLLIGHFLGVDHCGHRYGPNHPEMSRKLNEMNDVIANVTEVMDDNTMLFVIGDHGMTVTGDHGGESLDEITAGMFLYSKRPLLSLGKITDSVKQVDLVPTLSTILGIPIPFQNLGVLLYNSLPALEDSSTDLKSWELPLFWLWANVQQVIGYIRAYSQNTNIFKEEYLTLHYNNYIFLSQEIAGVDSEKKFVEFSEKATEFLISLRTLCEEVWIQFDEFSISNGLTFSFLSIFFMFIISDGIPLKHLPKTTEGSFIFVCCIGLLFSAISMLVLDFFNIIEKFLFTSIFVTNILSHFLFLLPLFQHWEFISINWHVRSKKYGVINLCCRFILIFNISVLFSNSFVNEEASVLLFLLATTIFLSLLALVTFLSFEENTKRKGEIISKGLIMKLLIFSVIILGCLRASMYFWRCRLEQQWCFASPHEVVNNSKSKTTKFQWGISVMSLVSLVLLTKIWLKNCGNLSGFSITVMLTKLIPTVIVVFISGFWVLQKFSGNKALKIKTPSYLALSVYGLTSFGIISLIIQPLCIRILPKNNDVSIQEGENVVPYIYSKLKGNFTKNKEELNKKVEVPIVCGLGTAYSAAYIILAVYLTFVIALVLGDSVASSAVIMFMTAVFVLVVTSILRIKVAESMDDLFNVPTLAVCSWIILAQYFFYATGHQPAFPNIAWEAAFIGTSGLFTHNYILGTLIILNTFGSYILMGVLLPLLIITPFTLFVMMPSILTKKKEFHLDAQKGELVLFEKDKLMSAAMFSLTCRYLAGHGIKVFASMLAATIHCRHLMVWNIFAPKFIFEAVAMFVTTASVFIGYLFFLRISREVEKMVISLNKIS